MHESTDTLWRYMKLSTLLLLLEGKAWFPAVASLRAGDPFEGALGKNFHNELWRALEVAGHGVDDTKKWLLESLPEEMRSFLNMNHDYPRLSSLQLGWAFSEALALRRAAWCWYRSDIESAAMWSIYGQQGVAVMTDRDRLNDALKSAFPSTDHFDLQEMTYVDRRSGNPRYVGKVLREHQDLILRPYLLKAVEYEHEKELRVATFCAAGHNGVEISNIDPEVLIREVAISPLLPASEGTAIKQFILNRINNIKVDQSNLTGENMRISLANIFAKGSGCTIFQDERPLLPPPLRSL